jgi:hypothetical protein
LEGLRNYKREYPEANETLQSVFAHGVNNELTIDDVNAIYCKSAYTTSEKKGKQCTKSQDLSDFITFIKTPLHKLTGGGKKSKKRRSKKNKKTKRRTKRYRI